MDILIVDDEPTASAIHSAYVRKLGDYKAVCFGNAQDALHWAATHNPAMVIVDYFMPMLDGIEFTRRFRRLPGRKSTPVLMVTSFGDADLRQLARSVGVDEFLVKPVDRLALTACIRNFSAASQTLAKTAAALGHPRDYDQLDVGSLATILAVRDRLRLEHSGSAEPASHTGAQDPLEQAPATASDEILIVDDERTIIAMLDYHVRKLNCYPVRFAQPLAALEWAQTHEPLAAIVDYMMPEIDGLEFTRRFRALPGKAETPMLMVSAHGDSQVQAAALEAGINEFLCKPIDASDLTTHLRTIIAGRELERRLAKHERLRPKTGE